MRDREEDRFIMKVVAFLQESVPAMQQEDPAKMYGEVRKLKEQAATFDMISERAVATFALTAALLGLDFVDRFDGARQILFRPVDQKRKSELLKAYTLNLLETLGQK
jgi:16S rRNA G527 N7-methylase RsmG